MDTTKLAAVLALIFFIVTMSKKVKKHLASKSDDKILTAEDFNGKRFADNNNNK